MKIYFSNFINDLRRYRISAILNILGLGLALAVSYIFLVHSYYHLTFNHNIDGAEHTYKLYGEYVPVCKNIGQSNLVEQMGSHAYTFYKFLHIALPNNNNQPSVELRFIVGEPSFPSTYGFHIVEGKPGNLSSPHSVLISERCSQKYGLRVGDAINIEDIYKLQINDPLHHIVGIYEDMPSNSDFADVDLFISQDISPELYTSYNNTNNKFFFRLRDTRDFEEFKEYCNRVKYSEFLKFGYFSDTLTYNRFKDKMGVSLVPVADTHLYDQKQWKMGNEIQKDNRTLFILAVGLMLLAFFNFFNFFMATLPTRIRKYNTEKIFGRRNNHIRKGIILDTTGQVLLAFIPAIFLIKILTPWLEEHQLVSVSLMFTDNIPVWMGIGMSSILLAILFSIYPAHYVTSIPTIMALQRSFGNSTIGRRLRYTLLTLQFVVSFVFLGYATFVQLQYRLMTSGDLGFDRENLYSISFEDPHHQGYSCEIPNSAQLQLQLRQEILKHPMVEDMTFCNTDLTSRDPNGFSTCPYKGEDVMLLRMAVAPNFFSFMKIKKTDGSMFSEKEFIPGTEFLVVSENARKHYHMDLTANNKESYWNYPIVGFCKDVRLHSMLHDKQEIGWVVNNKTWNGFGHIYFRLTPQADVKEVETWIKSCMLKIDTRLSEENLRFHSFEDDMHDIYQQEQRENLMYTLFGIVALGLPLMGIFGLVLFDTQYRRREIAIRRINGAKVHHIHKMFILQYLKIVGVAFVISLPITYVIINEYFQRFTEHISFSAFPILVTLLLVTGLTTVVVVAQVYHTARENPTKVLSLE